MGVRNSFASLFTNARKLLSAVDANADQLPGIEQSKTGLEQAVAEVQELAARRDTLTAEKQALSQQLKDAVGRTQEKTSELRSLLRFMLGMRNEKLVAFNVPPARLGVRRSKPSALAADPAAATPAVAPPDATGAPSTS